MIASVGLGLLVLPRLPGIGAQVNGAYLGIESARSPSSPRSSRRSAIIIFLASYLRDTRQLLVPGAAVLGDHASRRSSTSAAAGRLGRWRCSCSSCIRDLGSSLMFFGGFLAMLYVATEPRLRSCSRAWSCSRSGRGSSRNTRRPRARAASTPGATRSTALYDRSAAATRSRSRCSHRPTAGVRHAASGRPCSSCGDGTPILPAAHTDLIYAVIVERARAGRRLRRCCSSTCCFVERGLQDRDARARLASPSCSRPA